MQKRYYTVTYCVQRAFSLFACFSAEEIPENAQSEENRNRGS